jgi:ABC-type bacteriocin/lantibiotic exporter with double-glycine peptidase domain
MIPPFLALISDQSIINSNQYLLQTKNFLNFNDKDFLIFIAVSIFIIILLSNIFLSIISFLTKKIINNLNNSILSSLFKYYINLKFEESFLNQNSLSKITTKLNNEVARFCNSCLMSFFEIIKRVFAIFIMIAFLFYVEPIFTIYISLFFFIILIIFYKGLHKKLIHFGHIFTQLTQNKLSLVIESFSAIKEVKFLGIQNQLIREFFKNNIKLANADIIVYLLGNLPRYLLEIVSSFLFLSLLIYFIYVEEHFNQMIYTLSFVAVAAYKILPSLNTIMFNFSIFKSSLASYNFIKDDLENIKKLSNNNLKKSHLPKSDLNYIELSNIYYNYPNSKQNVLIDINLKFFLNKNYFIIGSSGSGKSTLIDIIAGIIIPKKGFYKFDDTIISNVNNDSINYYISYVPQQINFFNRSLLDNITLKFGSYTNEDILFVNILIDILNLREFINTLPDGIYSFVGDKSQNMSGGQRQRISIARALFRKKSILILDEATSSIDIMTEKKIIKNISQLKFIKSIISITHRENTLESYDNCIILDQGKIIFEGIYKNK